MKVCFRGEPARFDTNPAKHDHFLCNVCKAITDLPPLSQTDNDVEKDELIRRGFKVESKLVAYYGVCDKCNRLRLATGDCVLFVGKAEFEHNLSRLRNINLSYNSR